MNKFILMSGLELFTYQRCQGEYIGTYIIHIVTCGTSFTTTCPCTGLIISKTNTVNAQRTVTDHVV